MPTEKGMSQKHLVHLTYKPTSYVLIDSSWAFEEVDMNEVMSSIAGFDSLDVFITPKYFATISYNTHTWIHTVYDRKTRIIRRHVRYCEKDSFVEDSVMYYLHKDKKLREKAYNLKDSLSIEYTQMYKTIHGKKCHLITHPAYFWFSNQRDSFWVADFKHIPMLVGGSWYVSGITFEYIKNDGLTSVHVDSRITPAPNLSFDIFTIDPGLNELRQLQSQNTLQNFMEYFLR